MKYNPTEVESKWQKYWFEHQTFAAKNNSETRGEAELSATKWIPVNNSYYGEVVFNISYKGQKEKPFNWMYIDYNTLQNAALANGLNCELVLEGEHYDYLARLFL